MRDTNSRCGFVNSEGIHLLLDYLPRSEPTSILQKQEQLTQYVERCLLLRRSIPGMKMLQSEYILWMILRCRIFCVKKSTKVHFQAVYDNVPCSWFSWQCSDIKTRSKLSCWLKRTSSYPYLAFRSLAIFSRDSSCEPVIICQRQNWHCSLVGQVFSHQDTCPLWKVTLPIPYLAFRKNASYY